MIAAVFGFFMSIPIPPEAFDRPYSGEMSIVERPVNEVHEYCGGKDGPRMFACAMPMKDRCLVVLPMEGWVTKAQQQRLLRHEIGHCNGWGHDHAGGRQ